MFRPNIQQMTTQVRVKLRTESTVSGAARVSYADANPALDYCNWKSRGGSESIQSGTLVVEDTAEVVMWYRSDISKKTRLVKHDNPSLVYEVIAEPENVEERNVYLILKVLRTVNA